MTGAEVRHQLQLKTAQERLKRDLIELKAEVVVLAASGDRHRLQKIRARLSRCVARVDELVTLAGSTSSATPLVEQSTVPSPLQVGPAPSFNYWRVV